jgi:hypothetical protein
MLDCHSIRRYPSPMGSRVRAGRTWPHTCFSAATSISKGRYLLHPSSAHSKMQRAAGWRSEAREAVRRPFFEEMGSSLPCRPQVAAPRGPSAMSWPRHGCQKTHCRLQVLPGAEQLVHLAGRDHLNMYLHRHCPRDWCYWHPHMDLSTRYRVVEGEEGRLEERRNRCRRPVFGSPFWQLIYRSSAVARSKCVSNDEARDGCCVRGERASRLSIQSSWS